MPLIKSSKTDLVRIDLPAAGEWVEVKRALGRNDQREMARRMLIGRRVEEVDFDNIDAAMAFDASFLTIELAIVKWSFEDPVTPENVRSLDDDSLRVIRERLNELYPQPRTGDERKNSSGPTSEPSNPEARPLPNSDG